MTDDEPDLGPCDICDEDFEEGDRVLFYELEEPDRDDVSVEDITGAMVRLFESAGTDADLAAAEAYREKDGLRVHGECLEETILTEVPHVDEVYFEDPEPDYVEWSDGTPKAVLGPDQSRGKRLAAIEHRLRDAERFAQVAASEVKDNTTTVTLQARVADLEERFERVENLVIWGHPDGLDTSSEVPKDEQTDSTTAMQTRDTAERASGTDSTDNDDGIGPWSRDGWEPGDGDE